VIRCASRLRTSAGAASEPIGVSTPATGTLIFSTLPKLLKLEASAALPYTSFMQFYGLNQAGRTAACAGMLVLALLAGCGRASEEPLVWIAGGAYHTKRCADVPFGTAMHPLREALAQGHGECAKCAHNELPTVGALPVQQPLSPDSDTSEPSPDLRPSQAPPLAERPSDLAGGELLRSVTVHVDPGGYQYHRERCRHLRNGRALTLESASGQGLRPCEACMPPRLSAPVRSMTSTPSGGPRIAIPGEAR